VLGVIVLEYRVALACFCVYYLSSMKVKTSITLSKGLLEIIDERVRLSNTNRSDFIEAAVSAFIRQQMREEQNAKDLEIINRRADYLNQEAAEVLEYQIPL
jgi:metal-responsive CopG/Arc/MetJ family transcriptional regulator